MDAQGEVKSVKAHVFVVRGDDILIVHEANGFRFWGLPGGDALAGETPEDTAIRETFEETGLRIAAPELLREWSYRGRSGVHHDCRTFVAEAPRNGRVRLSAEHTEYAWMAPRTYAERHCSAHLAVLAPEYAHFLKQMRQDCAALTEHLAARGG